MPLVSIVIPIYNGENYLDIALESVLDQSYLDLEIILVDDCSTDNTVKKIKEYVKKYPTIQLVTLRKNGGVSNARNQGMKKATGKYLFFLDADDVIDIDAIRNLVKQAEENNADVVELKRLFWYKNKKQIFAFTWPQIEEQFNSKASRKKEYNVGSSFVTAKLYRREILGNQEFDTSIKCYEDILFSYQIRDKIKKYIFLDTYHYHYLQRPDSLANSFNKNHLAYTEVLKRIKAMGNLDINGDKFIIDSVMLLAISKVSKIDVPYKEKMEIVKEFLKGIDEMYPTWDKKFGWHRRIIYKLVKNKAFMQIYLPLSSTFDLVRTVYKTKGIFSKYRLKQFDVKDRIIHFYNKLK